MQTTQQPSQDVAQLSSMLRDELHSLRKVEEEGLTSKQQSDLWVKVGLGAIAALLTLGLFNIQSIQNKGMENSDDISELTLAVTELVSLNKSINSELTKQGTQVGRQDTYSEQSRIKDAEHDALIISMQADIRDLKAEVR